ncbi:hypothetical protein C8Q79DRAFT_594985 [Trametes meyenii]|nr:hypothetical protein C8Q79DRAFT_594985 [Trametes meyenii]
MPLVYDRLKSFSGLFHFATTRPFPAAVTRAVADPRRRSLASLPSAALPCSSRAQDMNGDNWPADARIQSYFQPDMLPTRPLWQKRGLCAQRLHGVGQFASGYRRRIRCVNPLRRPHATEWSIGPRAVRMRAIHRTYSLWVDLGLTGHGFNEDILGRRAGMSAVEFRTPVDLYFGSRWRPSYGQLSGEASALQFDAAVFVSTYNACSRELRN